MKVFSGISSYIISCYSCHLLPGIESCLDKLQVIGGFHNYLDVFNSNTIRQLLYFIFFNYEGIQKHCCLTSQWSQNVPAD